MLAAQTLIERSVTLMFSMTLFNAACVYEKNMYMANLESYI